MTATHQVTDEVSKMEFLVSRVASLYHIYPKETDSTATTPTRASSPSSIYAVKNEKRCYPTEELAFAVLSHLRVQNHVDYRGTRNRQLILVSHDSAKYINNAVKHMRKTSEYDLHEREGYLRIDRVGGSGFRPMTNHMKKDRDTNNGDDGGAFDLPVSVCAGKLFS